MKAIDLFSGAGGASIGLRSAGLDVVAHVDHDEDACTTLRANGWAGVLNCNVEDLVPGEPRAGALPFARRVPKLPEADVWSAGPPCQPFSHAGDREGAADDRDGFPPLLALVRLYRPRWLVIENVAGLLSHSTDGHPDTMRCPGCYLARILAELAELFPVVDWRLLDAADFGVPQHRRRVFIVCGPSPITWPWPTHSGEALEIDKAHAGRDGYWARMERGEFHERVMGDPWHDMACGPACVMENPFWHRSDRPWVTMRQALRIPLDARVVGGGTRPHAAGEARIHRDLTDAPGPTTVPHDGSGGPWVETGQRTTAPDGSRPLHRVQVDEPSPTVRGQQGTGLSLSQSQRTEKLDNPSHTLNAGATDGGYRAPFVATDAVDPDEHAPWWHRASPPDEPSRTVGRKANASILLDVPSGAILASDGAGALSKTARQALLDAPAPCVSATEVKGAAMSAEGVRTSQGGLQRASDALQLGTGRRRLTEVECALIQGFPPTYVFRGATSESVYRQIGNACPPKLVEVVAASVVAAERSGDADLFHRARSAGWEADDEHKSNGGALVSGWQVSARKYLERR